MTTLEAKDCCWLIRLNVKLNSSVMITDLPQFPYYLENKKELCMNSQALSVYSYSLLQK